MTATHYIEFVTDDKHASIGHCVSRLMTMLHGIMQHTGVNLGVSFPAMKRAFIGHKVRVFGTPEQLMAVLCNPQIQDASKRSVCSLSVYVPTPVPAEAKQVRYVVNRNGAPLELRFKKKMANYMRKNGEPMPAELKKKCKLSLANRSEDLPFVTIKSETAGIYRIFVSKKDVDASMTGDFNTHGMGNAGAAVFDF